MFRKIRRYIRDPYYEIGYDVLWRHPNWMSDKWFLKSLWKRTFGYELDLEHPKTFNEKLQWLKLYDRKPEYTTMVDKYLAKQWVADKIGQQYVIPTIAVYDSVDEIDLDKLPDMFVLKCNHDSGNTVICKDKLSFDLESAKQKLDDAVKKDYYLKWREWPYKNVKKKVLAEKYLETSEIDDLIDYKMMTFSGRVKCCFTCTNRRSDNGLNVTVYDREWERMPFGRPNHPADVNPIPKPKSYEEMVEISERLGENMPFVRVDFYEIEGRPYVGEMTLYPAAGFEDFEPQEWNRVLGDWIELPLRKKRH